MQNTKWKLKNIGVANNSLPIDNDILSILAGRSIVKKQDIIRFINPSLDNLQDPKKLYDMQKAVERLRKAIKDGEKICIYGDYDVDGITSTSILYIGLKRLGAKYVDYYIPVRDEGYGLNNEALKSIKDSGSDIIITVDCGITSYNEINYANSIGLTTIITDHHTLLKPEVPNAYAVINPKRLENTYGFDGLAGVGTAFMLLLELYNSYNIKEDAFEFLDLVAIGTIADIVPLISQNRIIVKFGLEILKNTTNLGLKKLCDRLFSDKDEDYEYTSGDVGFTIAPVFNAAGRLQDAKMVVKLLISDNEREIDVIIDELLLKNMQRKTIQNEIFEESKKVLEQKSNDYILIDSSKNYHHGVIGIVASKIVDTYYKPAIIMEEKPEEGIAVASCRSIASFNITKALQFCEKYLVKYGGHAGAAGFTIKIENIKKFSEAINEYAKKNLNQEDFYKLIEIDKVIPIQKISYEFYKTLELLKPFGFGNPTPVFLTQNVLLENAKQIGEKKNHLNFDISQKGYSNRGAVWFFKGDKLNEINKNLFYDIVYKININQYKGKYYTKVMVDDVKVSLLKEDKFSYLNSLYETSFPMKSIFYTNQDIDINSELELSFDYERVTVYNKRTYLARLDIGISRLLIQVKNFYNFKFSVKIEKIKRFEETNIVNIIIKRNYDFISYHKNDMNLFKKIKNELIQNLEYSSTTKKALSSLYKDDSSILISSKNILSDIKIDMSTYIPLILTFGMYNMKKHNKKSLFLTKNKLFTTNSYIKYYFDFKNDNNEYEYLVLDKNTYSENVDIKQFKKLILFDDSIEDYDNYSAIKNNIKLPSNVKLLSSEDIENIDIENIYVKSLPNSEKLKILKKIEENQMILADDSIIDIL